MMCLGTVYAWSYFQACARPTSGPTARSRGRSAWPSVSSELAAAVGSDLPRTGRLAWRCSAGCCSAPATCWRAFLRLHSLPLYSDTVVGGAASDWATSPRGMRGEVVSGPQGFATGMVVMGFGSAPPDVQGHCAVSMADGGNLVNARRAGGRLLSSTSPAAFVRNPPPAGCGPPPPVAAGAKAVAADATVRGSILSGRFTLMWWIFFKTSPPALIIGFSRRCCRTPQGQPRLSKEPAGMAPPSSPSARFNRAGQWGHLRPIGRRLTFSLILGTNCGVHRTIYTSNPWLFSAGLLRAVLAAVGTAVVRPRRLGSRHARSLRHHPTAWSAASRGAGGRRDQGPLPGGDPPGRASFSFAMGAGSFRRPHPLAPVRQRRRMTARPANHVPHPRCA